MADYGYFGKGAEGYAHYTQTFNSTFPSSGSKSSSRSTVHSSPSARVDTAKKADAAPQTAYDRQDYTDPDLENATLNVLFSVGMFVLAAVIFIAIVVSL
jgi:hypothetical protein